MKYNDFLGGLVALAFVSMPLMAVSQDFEDDIYYNPSKEKTTKSQKSTAPIRYVPTQDYPAADTYNYSSASTRDVDEYNRRYATTADTTARDSAYISDNFAYTRRIERFHNSDVVVASGDDQLIDYYYSQPSETSSVNIYVNADPYLGWGIYPYYGYYGYRPYYSYYNPWYSWRWTFDPWYWGSSWTWGYDPYWYGGWGYPYWAWSSPCPPHHHHHGYGPGSSWYPSSPGSYRPHGTASAGSTSSRRPGSTYNGYSPSGSGMSRPGNMGRGRGNTTATAPSTSTRSDGYAPSSTGSRPSTGYSGGSSRGRYGNSSSSTESRRSTYTPSRISSSSSSSRGSYSSGSRGGSYSSGSRGGSYGGGSHGGGGGGGRGRR